LNGQAISEEAAGVEAGHVLAAASVDHTNVASLQKIYMILIIPMNSVP
jgi:hypothetical protein